MIRKLRVTVDGKTYDVTVELPNESAAASTPASASVKVAPTAAAAPLPAAPRPTASPAATLDANDVPSPLSGRVIAVKVEGGQAVNEGDHLLTLEAMKMNTVITAPRAGTIKVVRVAVGDVVDEGQALVTLD